ncbi:hypothetical protein MMC07_008705, partial [Pseudocyphellaria aurata]|nr:hypothetical protein [Pseudocyphellaria aurata]
PAECPSKNGVNTQCCTIPNSNPGGFGSVPMPDNLASYSSPPPQPLGSFSQLPSTSPWGTSVQPKVAMVSNDESYGITSPGTASPLTESPDNSNNWNFLDLSSST